MCPACLTTMALIAAGATSTGGVAALIARRFHAPEPRESYPSSSDQRAHHHDQEHDASSENRVELNG
jgi:hypothetical protein